MESGTASIDRLILAKMGDGVERMETPQAIDEVRGMKA
jgi:hypothetical protein